MSIKAMAIAAVSVAAACWVMPQNVNAKDIDTAYLGAPSGLSGRSDVGSGALVHSRPWIFSAPPRGKRAAEDAIYEPIARFLTQVTGHRIIYRKPGNWLSYSQNMSEGKYDLVFDGPHFTSWDARYLGDTPLVRLPQPFVFAVVVRRDERFTKLRQLAGRPVCANSPPNLGTLSLLSQFSYITRQPYLVVVHGWPASYHGLMSKRCAATVLPISNLKMYEHGAHTVRVLYRTPVYPNQALSASPRIPKDIQASIQRALLSPAGRVATAALRKAYGGRGLIRANRREYAGLSHLLDNTLYFSGGSEVGIAQR